jgi:pilus assembly protein CpaE
LDQVATVVLAVEAPDVAEEVMHFLDRSGRARVVATASDDRQLTEAVRQLSPDAVVADPTMLGSRIAAGVVLALDTRESIASLRAAIDAGVAGYFVWPKERDDLVSAAAAAVRRTRHEGRRGLVVAVHGGRGGAGATFVATHLAGAFARSGSAILIDADPMFGDVAQVLGAPVPGEDDEPAHTLADAVALGDDLGVDQLRGALWRHASGVDVLLPPAPEAARQIGAADLRLVVDAAANAADATVVHLARSVDPITLACVDGADRVLEVVTLDVASFRAATRTADAFGEHLQEPVRHVVNKAVRSEISPDDVGRVFGEPALAVLPHDRSVRSAQERGRLLPARTRMSKRFDRLASALVADANGDGPASASA